MAKSQSKSESVVRPACNAAHSLTVPIARLARIALILALAAHLSARSAMPEVSFEAPKEEPNLPPRAESVPAQQIVPDILTPEQTADLHMARKRFQAAIQAYGQIQPKTAIVWNKLGIANQQMFMMDEARRSYEMSLKLQPRSADVLNNMGTLYYTLKQYGNAERYYRKALKVSPKSSLIYKNLGTALLAQDKLKKGWECYQNAMALDPDVFERPSQYRVGGPTPTQKRGAMNYYLAKSYLHVGMPDRAVGYLRMAIDEGYTDRKKVMADKEFASLRGISSFEQLLTEQRNQ